MADPQTNWAGNVIFHPRAVHHPASGDELQDLVAATAQIRALGTRHSFSTVADSTADLVVLDRLPRLVDIDPDAHTVTVSAGTRYGELATALDEQGWALHNLGSLPHIAVGGACATGTHGSGSRHGNLATAVTSMQLVTAGGEPIRLRRGQAEFAGAVIALGTLGVVTSVSLAIEPQYQVAQDVYDGVDRTKLGDHADDVFAAGYSVSVFTDWGDSRRAQLWTKRRVGVDAAPRDEWLGGSPADGPRHPVPGMPTDHCTEQLGVAGPSHERLPHFRLGFTPSSGEELQSEYLIARGDLPAALDAIEAVRARIAPVLQISELRTVAADDLWLSPSYQRESAAIHFTWIADADAVAPAVAAVEERLAPFAPRPHWGKVFTIDPRTVAQQYERHADFVALRRAMDPNGKFGNAFVDSYVPLQAPSDPRP